MHLYEIPTEARLIEEQLEESGGELTPELEQRINEFMAGSKDKIEAAAMVVRSLNASAEACKAEAKRLSERNAALERSADRLKNLMLSAVDLGFAGKIKTNFFTIWGQNSADTTHFDVQPDVQLDSLPERFVRVKRELNREELKSAFKAGEKLPETIIAVTMPGTRYLRIR